jgi:hypothetical protein
LVIVLNRKAIYCLLLALPLLSGCLIAYAPSRPGPSDQWIYEVCFPKTESQDKRTADFVAQAPPKYRTTIGQPVYTGSAIVYRTGADGTFFMVPESAEPGAEKKYYLFPLNIQVSDEWTPWTLAAQLDTKYPDFMDRFKRFGRCAMKPRSAGEFKLQGLPQKMQVVFGFQFISFPDQVSLPLRGSMKKMADCETTTGHVGHPARTLMKDARRGLNR